jgi:hypothetical protein
MNKCEAILHQAIKRILKTPTTTPRECITMETGIWDIEKHVIKKQIMYYHKIRFNKQANNPATETLMHHDNPWNKQVNKYLNQLNIKETDLEQLTRTQLKIKIHTKLKEQLVKQVTTAGEHKTKVRELISTKTLCQITTMKRPDYMDKLTRHETSLIFRTRASMLPLKANFKATHADTTCRWCKTTKETQEHILTQCPQLKIHITQVVTYESYFKDSNANHLKRNVKILQKITQEIQKTENNKTT